MVGPPGAGKTMLARRLPGLLPVLDAGQSIEVSCIHSAAGLPLPDRGLVEQSTVSRAAPQRVDGLARRGRHVVVAAGRDLDRALRRVVPRRARRVLRGRARLVAPTARRRRDPSQPCARLGGAAVAFRARRGDEPLPVWCDGRPRALPLRFGGAGALSPSGVGAVARSVRSAGRRATARGRSVAARRARRAE